MVPRPDWIWGKEEEEHRGVSAQWGRAAAQRRFITHPVAAPCRLCGHTQDPGDMCVRETRESPTAHMYREGSRDLCCKRGTEINTGNTYPAGVQSKYMGHVQCVTDSQLPPNPCTWQPLGTHTVCTTQVNARKTYPVCIPSRYGGWRQHMMTSGGTP